MRMTLHKPHQTTVGLTEFLFRALGSAWLLLTAIHSRAFKGLDRVSLQPQDVAANGWQSEQNGVGEATGRSHGFSPQEPLFTIVSLSMLASPCRFCFGVLWK